MYRGDIFEPLPNHLQLMLWYSPMNLLVRNLTARADLPTWDPPTTVTFTLGLSFSLRTTSGLDLSEMITLVISLSSFSSMLGIVRVTSSWLELPVVVTSFCNKLSVTPAGVLLWPICQLSLLVTDKKYSEHIFYQIKCQAALNKIPVRLIDYQWRLNSISIFVSNKRVSR